MFDLGVQNEAGQRLTVLPRAKKVMTNLDSRDITLLTKIPLVKAVVFPVVLYGCESWTAKKAEAKELMVLNCGVAEDS